MPEWKQLLRDRLAPLGLQASRENDIVEEWSQHLDDRHASLVASGLDFEQAATQTVEELDDPALIDRLAEALRPVRQVEPVPRGRRNRMVIEIWRDVRYALRRMGKQKAFTAAVVVVLALAIGGNTAMFSIVDGVLLRPLDYPEADRLVFLFGRQPELDKASVSSLDFLDWKAQSRSFSVFAAGGEGRANLTGAGEPVRVSALPVSASFFQLFGVRLQLGRAFLPADEKRGGVAILTHGFWQERFGADPQIVGESIVLDGRPHEVIGVLPAGFPYPPIWGHRPDVIVPLDLMSIPSRGEHWLWVAARLRPGTTIEQAQRELDVISERLAKQYPSTNNGTSANVVAMREHAVANVRTAFVVLLVAVGLVLLIACTNAANLLLARTVTRRQEMAIRTAHGACARDLIRQVLTESFLLSLFAGIGGIALAVAGKRALLAIAPASYLPRAGEVEINASVLLFTLSVVVLTGLLFGAAPALHAARVDLGETLQQASTRIAGNRRARRFRDALVVAELALAVVLLIAAGLLIRTLHNYLEVDPGFDPRNVFTAQIDLPSPPYDSDERVIAFYDRLLGDLRSQGSIEGASIVNQLPFGGSSNGIVQIEGRPRPAGMGGPLVQPNAMSPEYFGTMAIPILRGRTFNERDRASAAPVAIVNEAFVERLLPNENPLGKRVSYGDNDFREIVGVVRDVSQWSLGSEAIPEIYFPFAQRPTSGMRLAVRSSVDPNAVADIVRSRLRDIDPDLPLVEPTSMERRMERLSRTPRFQTQLMSTFAGLALLLTIVGVYGVMSYDIAQRTREFAVRAAFGAQRSDIGRLVLTRGMFLAGMGVALGIVTAFGLTRFARSMLFGISPTDPLTFGAVPLLLLCVGALACGIPALRATRVEPTVALRHD